MRRYANASSMKLESKDSTGLVKVYWLFERIHSRYLRPLNPLKEGARVRLSTYQV
jgi:hypothetical protein